MHLERTPVMYTSSQTDSSELSPERNQEQIARFDVILRRGRGKCFNE
jgi:hypothetical protein